MTDPETFRAQMRSIERHWLEELNLHADDLQTLSGHVTEAFAHNRDEHGISPAGSVLEGLLLAAHVALKLDMSDGALRELLEDVLKHRDLGKKVLALLQAEQEPNPETRH